jgi:hypothetical protein
MGEILLAIRVWRIGVSRAPQYRVIPGLLEEMGVLKCRYSSVTLNPCQGL